MNNNVGLFDTITADYIVAGAKMELDLTSTTTQDVYLLNKVNEVIPSMRDCFTLIPAIAELSIDLVTFSAKLPSGFVRLIGANPVRLLAPQLNTNINGNTVTGTIDPIGNVDGFYKGLQTNYTSAEVVDGYLYFGSGIQQDTCLISYISTNVDANGDLKIPSLAYRPLVAYLCSEWLYKSNDPRYSKWDERWRRGKRWIKGIMAQPDSLEQQEMGYINNHMAAYRSPSYWLF
jgi:hypothetical protein